VRTRKEARSAFTVCAQIRREREAYYDILGRTQRETMDVTAWIDWFLGCFGRAIEGARENLSSVLRKARFWDRIGELALNERQRMMLNRLLDGLAVVTCPKRSPQYLG
jgi:Fic family protein